MPRISLSRVPLGKLEAEIARRRAELPKLIARRDELNRCIAELEGLAAPAPPAAKKARKTTKGKRRAKRTPAKANKMTLNEALEQVLKGKEGVSSADAAEGVLALGYTTRSKKPRLLVYQALYHGDQFKKVGRDLFALKG